MSGVDADVIVIGGGCAGLSLGTRLADLGTAAPRTLILEPRHDYANDRTWSGWRTAAHRFSDCVRASWPRWALSCQGRDVLRGEGALPYETIPADRFYTEALRAIAGNDAVTLRTGVTAQGWGQAGPRAYVTTDQGTLWSRLVIDTRPPPASAGSRGLLQSFTGLEVETEHPCFDPTTVGLMAFGPGEPDAITFLYTLPFSATRALLELTHMTPQDRAAPSVQIVRDLLSDRLNCDFTVVRSESGCLPMRNLAGRETMPPRLLRLGTPAGALRASTGYGFANIQSQSENLARVLRGGAESALGWQAPRPAAWMRGMDSLFLRVLRRSPERGPEMFTGLFEHCAPSPLVRFLTGTGSLADGARVAMAMPVIPFLREILPLPNSGVIPGQGHLAWSKPAMTADIVAQRPA